MTIKGQIVEIPENSPLYKREISAFLSKKESLLWESQKNRYSLFDGFLVGEHAGVDHFKTGQRKGINVGGKKKPLYVIAIDKDENRLFVGAGENHPGLWANVLSFPETFFHWNRQISFTPKERENGIAVEVLASAVEEKIPAKLYIFDDTVFFEFDKPALITIRENPVSVFYRNTIIANTIN
ncbi:tRNA methyl transferase PRC-barrel domain-containing protein [Chryseobacterium sp. MDT2-18]|uniref:tRNA methyl transferase PRC-barrel domain-containing protein n=1 Tax=Chryseobacterium sp. MDT2-18 TaxID=1259136 RepID=UPI002785F24C|nr:tRNA methyl transferase PRC-barrel domain-containing protein [Chryseobacterium sp. MDT2-18]MDQ0477653.1 tRNA U34 2-thiouridine synthase MnmA/TrmU [Chryseobacterium sp. MDT2-18]